MPRTHPLLAPCTPARIIPTSSPLWYDHAAVQPLCIPVHITSSHLSPVETYYPTPSNIPVRITNPHTRPGYGQGRRSVRVLHSIPCSPKASLTDNTQSSSIKMCLINARSVANKAHILNDLFTRENLDILFVTETWQQNMEFIHLNELCPVDCSFIGTPRLSGRGGGLAVVWNNRFSCQLVNTEPFTTFELQLTKVGRLKPFYCVLIYRPPGPAGQFLSEFTDFLASIIKLEKVLLVGDFNLHIDDASNVIASEFLNITESFNFRQHVSGATHIGGHTLDLVFSLGLDINNICCEDLLISDHKCIFFTLSATAEPLYPVTTLRSRIITQTTAEQFSAQFCHEFNADFNNVEFLVQSFNKQCSALLDKVAPLKVMSRATNNSSPWVTDAVRRLRQMCRRSERLWKATGLEVHRLYLKELRQSFNVSVREARSAYFANLISSSKRNPKVLFDTINNLVAPPPLS